MPKTYAQLQEAHRQLIKQLVNEWWECASRYANGGFGFVYLVGTKRKHDTGEIWGSMRVVIDGEETASEIPVRPDPIPCNMTRETAYYVFEQWLRREPIFTMVD